MSDAVRTRRPDIGYEPRPGQAGVAGQTADPLAELARLVGQEDPFRAMFRNEATPAPGRRDGNAPSSFAEDDVAAQGDVHDPRYHASGHEQPSAGHEWAEHEHEAHGESVVEEPRDPYGAYEPEAPGRDHALDGDNDADHHPAVPVTPDVWAEGADAGAFAHADAAPGAESRRAARRPLVVLAAVMVLTGGGLAATFLARTSSGSASGKGAPTILAASGPTKVKPADSATSTPDDGGAPLLGRNAASANAPVKVVTSQEQPLDLAQLPKSDVRPESGAAGTMSAANGGTSFPEPKKVKTFVVHPDASMFSDNGAPAAATRSGAAPDTAGFPVGMTTTDLPAPRAATPKTAARASTTPKVTADTTIADLAQAASAPGAKARQPASPGVHAGPKPKATETADAGDAAAGTGTGGGFGLQLAAAPTEQDARDAFTRLQKKYASQLGAYKPTIRKAENGDKAVYRVRVGNLGQDEAKSMCSQLQASGGTCFVVHN